MLIQGRVSKVCCGSDYTCCGETGVYDLPVLTAISKPPGLARATSAGTSSMGSLTAIKMTQQVTQTGMSPVAGGGDKSRNTSIGLGVGLGVPLAIALLMGGFVIFRARRHQRVEPEYELKREDVTSQRDQSMMQLGNGHFDDDSSPQHQQPLRQSATSEPHGRGRDIPHRNEQEVSGQYH